MRTVVRGKVTEFFESNWFFVVIILLFGAEALWIAFTNRYPMAFDEGQHFQLIQFFSHRLNPIVTSQQASTYHLGNIAHDPSFLYYYILGFPYRIIAHISSEVKVQVISLRLFNVAFAIGSLAVFRKSIRLIGLKASWASIIVLAFAFTPIFSVLSAQINYDNLLILCGSITIYLLLSLLKDFHATQKLNVRTLLTLICFSLLASEVKYAYLPVLVGLACVLAWLLLKAYRINKKDFFPQLRNGFQAISKRRKALLLVAGLSGLMLFGASYGLDVVRYHSPVPQCNQVLSTTDCSQYYAWNRNYQLSLHKTNAPLLNVVGYSEQWLKTATYQLFAEIIPTGGLVPISHGYERILIVVAGFALICTITQARRLIRDFKSLIPVSFIAICYTLFLWGRNYHDYRSLGQPIAIQGRYLLPVLVYFYLILGLGIIYFFKQHASLKLVMRPAIVTMIVAGFIYFGGYVGYISQVSPSFGWVPATTPIAKLAKPKPLHTVARIKLAGTLV